MAKADIILQPADDQTEYVITHGMHGGVVVAVYDKGEEIKPTKLMMDVRDRTVTVTFKKPLERPVFVAIVG